MSLRIRFRFDGRCSVHPRYNPEKDGRTQHKDCPGCESLYVIWLYSGIACKKAENGEGLVTSHPARTEEDNFASQPGSEDEFTSLEETETGV